MYRDDRRKVVDPVCTRIENHLTQLGHRSGIKAGRSYLDDPDPLFLQGVTSSNLQPHLFWN